MMAASHSELNYHLTLKIPHLFFDFFDRNLSNIWHEAAAHFLSLSFCPRRPIVTKQINGDFLGQCNRCYVSTTWRPLVSGHYRSKMDVGFQAQKQPKANSVLKYFFTKRSEY